MLGKVGAFELTVRFGPNALNGGTSSAKLSPRLQTSASSPLLPVGSDEVSSTLTDDRSVVEGGMRLFGARYWTACSLVLGKDRWDVRDCR